MFQPSKRHFQAHKSRLSSPQKPTFKPTKADFQKLRYPASLVPPPPVCLQNSPGWRRFIFPAFRLLIFSITIVALIVMLIIETFYGFVEVTLQNAYFTLTVDLEFMFCLVYADGLAHLPSFGIAVETGKQTAGGCAGSQLSWWPSGKVTSNSDCSVKRMRVPSGSMRQLVAPL